MEDDLDSLTEKAEAGDASAQWDLGRHFVREEQPETALHWYQRSLDTAFHPLLASEIAYFHRDGVGTAQDWSRALHFFERAVETDGWRPAYYDVAWFHYWGLGTARDPTRAAAILEEALAMPALYDFGGLALALAAQYASGNGVEHSPQRCVELLRSRCWARQGLLLGHATIEGIGCTADRDEGMRILEAANGKLSTPVHDPAGAAAYYWDKWLAAWRDDPKAQLWTVKFMRNHHDRHTNYNWHGEEMRWLRRAADAGLAEAQYELGECFQWINNYNGVRVRNRATAIQWKRLAAAQGHEQAMEELGYDDPAQSPVGPTTVAEKLDLAKAYLELGDPEGGRFLLEQVRDAGDNAQRDEVMALLEDIGPPPDPPALAKLKRNVAAMLDFPGYPPDIAGLIVDVGRSRVFVRAVDEGGVATVRLHVCVIDRVESVTPGLTSALVSENRKGGFGHFALSEDRAQVHCTHSLRGDALEPGELLSIIISLAARCDALVDYLA